MKQYAVVFLLLIVGTNAISQVHFYPSSGTVSNKPYAPSQAVPTDARTFYYDSTNFTYRPYQSTAEVLTYLNLAKYRTGLFDIAVNSGGILSGGLITGGTNYVYYFRDGTTDGDLVLKVPLSSGIGTTLQYVRGDGSLATFPTSNSSFSNGASYEITSNKDATGGYVGLTLFKINFKNAANTFTSLLTNSNTAARTYTFPDKSMTVADAADVTTNATNIASNTTAIALRELLASKDATGGYAGLTLYKINFKNAANTFTSLLTNTNTAARTYTFQDRSGTIADQTSIHDSLDATTTVYSSTDFAGAGTNASPLTATKAYTINAQTVSYTGVLTDAGKLITISNASANNFTVPLNSSVAYPIGTQIIVVSTGAGQTTIVATGGVTINSIGGALKLTGQYSVGTLVKVGLNSWVLYGSITT